VSSLSAARLDTLSVTIRKSELFQKSVTHLMMLTDGKQEHDVPTVEIVLHKWSGQLNPFPKKSNFESCFTEEK
jgi:hypothetical protein